MTTSTASIGVTAGPEDAVPTGRESDADTAGDAPAGGVDRRAPGTVEMAELLGAMTADLTPARNPYLNSARAQRLAAMPTPVALEERVQWAASLAREQLLAGDVEPAIRGLDRIRDAMGGIEAMADREVVRQLTSLLAIAWLRLGEIENCQARHTVDSCLLPIQGEGVHELPRGSENAKRELEALLAAQPDDLTARWLLNIAAMTLGEHPEGVPERWRIPESAYASDQSLHRFVDVAPAAGVDIRGLSGGGAMEDLDADGDLDLFVTSWGIGDNVRYLRNDGPAGFTDHTSQAGLNGITGGLNLITGDYDNDGLVDLYILRGAWMGEDGRQPNSMLRNLGGGRFEDVTRRAGLLTRHPTQTAAWADYDGDGDLDLYVGNETTSAHAPHPSQLFRNEGDGTFTEVGRANGVDVVGYVKAVVWGDIENDGDPDLFISRLAQPNVLLRNDGPSETGTGWRFTDISAEAGIQEPIVSFPAAFFDVDQDGWLDLFVSGYGNRDGLLEDTAADVAADVLGLPTDAATPRLYINRGDGSFRDATEDYGLDVVAYTMGFNVGDLDADGWPDLYLGTGEPDPRALMANLAFRNVDGQRFADVTAATGLGHLQKGHAVSFGDIDRDGDQDIHAVMGGAFEGDWFYNALFENPVEEHRWLTLRLDGRAANRSAIGARVRVDVDTPGGGRSIHRVVGTGGSFGANSLQLELGLADATAVRSVTIHWPGSGTVDNLEDVALDTVLRIQEGGSIEAVDGPSVPLPDPLSGDHGGHDG